MMDVMEAGRFPGSMLNMESYEIDDKILGQGSYGIVGEAVLRHTQESFAVKIIEKSNGAVQDFKIEAEILRKLNHPYILRYHNFYEDSTKAYLFTEIVRGGELFDRMIERNGFNEMEAQTIFRKIFSAVNYCHRNGIVHRDIKAENVLLVSNDADYDLRLIDFGFATKAEGISLRGELGTPDYMAPEIWGGDKYYGAPVDMWALGVLVYMILVSYPPFLHHTPLGIKTKIIRGIYEFHPEYWDHISEDAKDFVTRLLTVDMNDRMTAEQALRHPWLATNLKPSTTPLPSVTNCSISKEEHVLCSRRIRKRRIKNFYTAPMAINRMRRLYSFRKNGRSADAATLSTYGYLASLSMDTYWDLDDGCSVVSGYDSDSTGQRSPAFAGSYLRSQFTSLTVDELSQSATKAVFTDGSGTWAHLTPSHSYAKSERSLIRNAARCLRFSRASSCSAGTDSESFSGATSCRSSANFSSLSDEDEGSYNVSQILLELAKVDEND